MADVDIDVDIDTADAVEDIRRLNSAVDSFDNRIRKADDTTKKFERRLGGSFRQALQDVRILFGAIGIGIFIRELVSVNAAFEQVKTTLVAASDNMNIVASDFAFIRSEAVRLGMPVSQVGGEFARLAAATRGTTLEGGPAREIYSALAESFVATGQSADEFRLAILAVNQMVSKGRVQAEELRGQLGERLPGAYQAAARALNMTTAELSKALEMGQVTADRLLPALAVELRKTFGSAFEAARNSPRFIMGQFQVAIESLLYTLSNQGFMREFLGLLRDISDYLASDEGQRGAERLGSAIGFLMAQFRAAAMIIVRNADTVVAAIAGLGATGLIMGLRAIVGFLGSIIGGAGGLAAALLSPWGLLAIGVGVAVAGLAKYGDALITVGDNTARLGDWFKAVWDVPSQRIRDDLLPAIRDYIAQLPVIGSIWVAAETGLAVFNETFAGTNNLVEAFKAAMQGVSASLKTALGPEIWAQLTSAFSFLSTTAETLKSTLGTVFNNLVYGAQIAWIYLQEFGKLVIGVFAEVIESVVETGKSIWSILGNVGQLLSDLFGQIDMGRLVSGLSTIAAFIADVFLGSFLTVVDLAEWAIKAIAGIFDLLMPILSPIAEAIGAVFNEVVEYIGKLANIDVDLVGLESMADLLKYIGDTVVGAIALITGVVSLASDVIGQILTVIFDVVGGVWTMAEDIVSAIIDIFSFLTQESQTAAVMTADATKQGAAESANAWITVGNIGVGVFVSIIEIIGQVIKQLTNLVQAIIQVGRRFGSFFSAIGTGFDAMMTRDADKAQQARDQFAAIFSEPISVGFADDFRSFTSGFGDNFNIVSNAVGAATGFVDGVREMSSDIGDNFGRVGNAARTAQQRAFGPNSEINREAGANGAALAAAYFGGMADEIANRASTLTDAATAEQRALEAAQRDQAANAARAFADREAGINRDDNTPPRQSGGGRSGRGRSSPEDRAQDRIRELAVEIMMNNQLTQALENQNLTRDQMEATVKATEALRRAGYDMTYQEAIAQGGLAAQLAAVAYEAETTERRLNDVKKAVDAIGDIGQENSSLETQLRAARDLSVSREEYAFQSEAVQELQKANINLTYDEAIAQGGLARRLAEVAYQRARLKDEIEDANRIADAIEGYQNQANALGNLVTATSNGVTSSLLFEAAQEAQNAVLSANGDTLWENYEALDANERKLYDLAYANSVAALSGKSWGELAQDITSAFNDIFDPVANAREEITRWSEASRLSLEAMYNNIVQKTPEITAAYQALMGQLATVTQVEMMRNSDVLSDRFAVMLIDLRSQVDDWAGNIASIWNNAFDGMTDVLTDFVMTGKLEWRDFALSVIKEITAMMIKWMAFQALKAVGSMFGIPIPFANGGIMTSQGSVPLKQYAKGGIANSPQMALFGEGSLPEAYVPLPDGRTIPVTLTGLQGTATQAIYNTYVDFDPTSILGVQAEDAMMPRNVKSYEADTRRSDEIYSNTTNTSGDIVIHTEVNYTGPSGGVASVQGNGTDSTDKMMKAMAKEISQLVRVQVIEVMRDETRPGGQFNRLGRKTGM